jgi:WD40 repeat protein
LQSANDFWIHLAVGLENGSVKEFKFAMNKRKSFNKDFIRSPTIQTDCIASRLRTTGPIKMTSTVYFYKDIGPTNVPTFGYAGQEGCKFEFSSDNWMTCSATQKMRHFFGDVRGNIHVFASGHSDHFECQQIEKVHSSTIVSLAFVENSSELNLLATASNDGFIRLWKIEEESSTEKLKFSQIGEFCGRGIPFIAMTAPTLKKTSKNEGTNLLVCDKIGVYVLDLHFLQTKN